MRILNVAQTYFPYRDEGGRPVKVRVLSRKLAERGHKVTVLTANLGSSEWSRTAQPTEESPMGLQMTEGGVVAIYLPTLVRYRTLTINPRVMRFCRALGSQFDLVHFYGLYDLLGPTLSSYCRRQGVPYVIEPMGMYRPIDRSIWMKKIWHRSLGEAFWRNAAKIIATSELEQQELLEDGVDSKKVVIRYNGIDTDSYAGLPSRGGFREQWGISEIEPLVVFLGRLIPRKGADLLIEAFAEALPEKGHLVIAGPEAEPAYRAYLEKCARNSGVGARVIFTGPLYGDGKKALLADADVFALPSRYENFANAAAEAMACGVPVIITESCGIRSLVAGRAGLVVALEKGRFVAALRNIINDKALYARLKDGCRGVADQLCWDRLAEQMENHYNVALAGSNGVH